MNPSDHDEIPDEELPKEEGELEADDPAEPVGSLASLRIRRRSPGAHKRALLGGRPTPPPERAPERAPERPLPEDIAPPARPHIGPRSIPAPSDQRADEPRRPQDIVAYWRTLRATRRYPRTAELDTERIAEEWPTAILLRCRAGSRALEPVRVLAGPQVSPSGLADPTRRGGVDLSPMMLQWLVGLAGEVVREGRPMEDVETFPSPRRSVEYRAIALPLSDDNAHIDHVLCHVKPAS